MQLRDNSAVSVMSLREEDEKVKRRLSNIRYMLNHHLSNLRKNVWKFKGHLLINYVPL